MRQICLSTVNDRFGAPCSFWRFCTSGCGSSAALQDKTLKASPRSPPGKPRTKLNDRQPATGATFVKLQAHKGARRSLTIRGSTSRPLIAETRHGRRSYRRRQAQAAGAELPSGILTAGSFDDNIYPPYFRSFLNKAGQNPFVGNLADKLLGRRVEIFVKNGQARPVGNAHVRDQAGSGRQASWI